VGTRRLPGVAVRGQAGDHRGRWLLLRVDSVVQLVVEEFGGGLDLRGFTLVVGVALVGIAVPVRGFGHAL